MTKDRHTLLRSLHDLGLAAWFGGNLMGAIGVNKAAAEANDPSERTRLSSIGWAAWAPAQAAFIGAHLVGSLGLLYTERGRVVTQSGARANSVTKTLLTAAALGTTAASGVFGAKVGKQAPAPSATATEPSGQTPPAVAEAQRALKPLQWATPALTAALVVLTAQQGEYQRTTSPLRSRLGASLLAATRAGARNRAARELAGKAALLKIA